MKTAIALLLTLAAAGFSSPARAQDADTVLLNGKIVTLDSAAPLAEALAVRDGRIIAVGRSADIRALAGGGTRVVDLGGRTVIPGLINSHMHAIRAALFYATEVNWIGAKSIPEAMDAHQGRGATRKARPMDHRRRRLDRAAVPGEAPADASGAARRRAGQSGLCPAVLQRGAADTRGLQGAQHRRRRRRAAATARSSATRQAIPPAGSPATIRPSPACSTSCRCRPSTRASRAPGSSSASSTASA